MDGVSIQKARLVAGALARSNENIAGRRVETQALSYIYITEESVRSATHLSQIGRLHRSGMECALILDASIEGAAAGL